MLDLYPLVVVSLKRHICVNINGADKMNKRPHIPVLLQEVIKSLQIKDNGVYDVSMEKDRKGSS